MSTFFRGAWSQLWLQLTADEPLGVLDTGYMEDYFGQDGQISLLHESGQRYSVLMAPVPTDSRVNFRGFAMMTVLPNGSFSIQGRVRDVLGNATILGEVASPTGTERVLSLGFQIAPGSDATPIIHAGVLQLQGGIRAGLGFPRPGSRISFPRQDLRAAGMGAPVVPRLPFPSTRVHLSPLVH